MEQSKYVVHNRGLSQILFAKLWSLRSLFKHILVVSYVVLITIIAFHFNQFKDSIESAIRGSETIDISAIARINAPELVWNILLVFLEITLLKRSLKMLQLSNNNIWIYVLFSILTLGFAIFIAIFLPGWMHDKLVSQATYIDGFKQLGNFAYIFFIIPGISILWLLANAFNERRVSPFISRANLWKVGNLLLWILVLTGITILVNMLLLNKETVSFNYRDPLQLSLIVIPILLSIAAIVSSIWLLIDMKRKINYKFFGKNIAQAVSIVMIVPIAILLMSTFLVLRGNWMEWLFIGIVCADVCVVIVYSFIRKTEAGSPIVFSVVVSLMLTIIWMSKFFFEYFWNYNIDSRLTLPIALAATTIIFIVIYFKSPMVSNVITYLFSRFVKAIWLAVIGTWTISFVPAIGQIIPVIPELLNVLLMSLPIVLLTTTLAYWYATQYRIKTHLTLKENKKDLNKKNMKEVNNV